jgi:hypothetical protein
MPRTLDRFLLVAALVAGGFSLAGCKQEEGEYCEVSSDCAAGLMCQSTGRCSAMAPVIMDAGPSVPSGTTDGGTDQAAPAPAGPDALDLAPEAQPAPPPDATTSSADGSSS